MSSESGERRPAARMTAATGQQKPSEPENLPCPRCDSTNTKFCYYNNYNLSQPRHFCKSCRRYWTRGGTLRNVPVGGGTRKPSSANKRPRTTTLTVSPQQSEVVQTGSGSVGPEFVSGSGSGCEVNLNEAVPDPGAAGFTSLLGPPVDSLGGFGLGLGYGFGFGLGIVDWPPEPVNGGSSAGPTTVIGPGNSGSCNTWQLGGNVVGDNIGDGGDYFGWSELAISAPGRRS